VLLRSLVTRLLMGRGCRKVSSFDTVRSRKSSRRKSVKGLSQRRADPVGSVKDNKHGKKADALSKGSEKPSVGQLFEALVALQARLRAPGGCPWDREQTHDSLRTYLVEEAYEVLAAIDSGDPQELAAELGDLLLQIVFHSELAREAGRFDVGEVIEHVHAKMVRRHPHVFGDVQASTSAQVLKNWEELKTAERRAAGKSKRSSPRRKVGMDPRAASLLDGVPNTLPAIIQAHQLTRRAASVGFDWNESEGLFQKLTEEAGELHAALESGEQRAVEEEVGDLLFVCVNFARFLGLNAELALRKANRKFEQRFRDMERIAAAGGKQLKDISRDGLEALWNEGKGIKRTSYGN
jgi:MazG family protein